MTSMGSCENPTHRTCGIMERFSINPRKTIPPCIQCPIPFPSKPPIIIHIYIFIASCQSTAYKLLAWKRKQIFFQDNAVSLCSRRIQDCEFLKNGIWRELQACGLHGENSICRVWRNKKRYQ